MDELEPLSIIQSVEQRENGEVLLLELRGMTTTGVAVLALQEKIREVLKETSYPVIIFDMPDMTYVDTAGIGAYWTINGQLNNQNRRLILCGMAKKIKDLFNITPKLLENFRVAETKKEALALADTLMRV